MTARRKISDMQRERIFLANGGVCHLCERKIRVGEPWDVSHDRPLALLGEDGGDTTSRSRTAPATRSTRPP